MNNFSLMTRTDSWHIINLPHLRRARYDDLPALHSLIQESMRGLGTQYYSPSQVESALKYAIGIDTRLVSDGTFYVVKINGQVAGCGGWSRYGSLHGDGHEGTQVLRDPAKDTAVIRTVFVHPAYARRGIASLIMHKCMEESGKAGFKRLELLATLTGVGLYERFGFVKVEDMEFTLPDGVMIPVERMIKTL